MCQIDRAGTQHGSEAADTIGIGRTMGGSSSVVERLLAKEEVASSTLVFRSSTVQFDPPAPRPKWRNGRRGGLKNR